MLVGFEDLRYLDSEAIDIPFIVHLTQLGTAMTLVGVEAVCFTPRLCMPRFPLCFVLWFLSFYIVLSDIVCKSEATEEYLSFKLYSSVV